MGIRPFSLFILTRLVVVLAIFGATTFLFLQRDLSLISRYSYGSFAILSLFVSTVTLLVLIAQRRRLVPQTILAHLLIVTDLLYTSILVVLTGGVLSPFPSLFLIVIIGASITLSRREAILAASLCTIVYGALLNLQYYGYLTPLRLYPADFGLTDPRQAVYTLFLSTFVFFLAAILTGYLSERVRRGEEALEAREIDYAELKELHDTIVRSVESGFITLTADGKVRVFNPYAVMTLNRTIDQVYDRRLVELFPPFAPILEQGGRGEVTIPGNDGDERILGVHLIGMEGGKGNIIHFKDITEIKRLRERLARSDRLAALGEMAARMAHEIRNPLASMSGSAQLLASSALSGEEKRLLAILERESTRLNRLLTEFLDYAREYRPECHEVDLPRFCNDLHLLVSGDERFRERGMELRVSSGSGWFDPLLIQQALVNILINAADASPPGAPVTLDAECREGGTRFSVIDRGEGFPPSVLDRLYEPFCTTKPGGSGLGLSIVHRIVGAHGGGIQLYTRQGEGTTVTITLPGRDRS